MLFHYYQETGKGADHEWFSLGTGPFKMKSVTVFGLKGKWKLMGNHNQKSFESLRVAKINAIGGRNI